MARRLNRPDCCHNDDNKRQRPASRLFTLVTLFGLCINGCVTAPSSPPITQFTGKWKAHERVRDRLAPVLRRLVDKNELAGMSVALVDGQTLVWAEGFGFADQRRAVPADPHTVYRAGSIAKLFTATAVMQLDEQGRIDVDRPVRTYLPRFSIRSRFAGAPPLTVRHLLSHHGGLPSDRFQGMWTETPLPEITAMLSDEYATFPPGYIFGYSNLGYSVLGDLIRQVGGMDFAEYMDRNVFGPMGMKDSSFQPTERIRAHLATGYSDGEARPLLPIRDVPAMSLYTTAIDLARFMRVVFAHGKSGEAQIASPESLAEMLRPQNLDAPLDFDTRVGLGWSLDPGQLEYAGRVARHGGNTPLFTAELIVLPDQELGVAVLSNATDSGHLIRQIAENILLLAVQAKTGMVPPERRTTQGQWVRTKHLSDDAAGEYVTDFGIIAIFPKKNELCARTLGQTYDLVPFANGWFGVGENRESGQVSGLFGRMRLTHERIAGRDILISHYKGRRRVFGEKIPHGTQTQAWQKREGRYRASNADPAFPLEDVTLRREQGILYLEYRMPAASAASVRLPIAPISEREAVTLGLGRSGGETLYVSRTADGERLHYSGYALIKVD